jgi:hypothetical protein
MNPVKIIYSCRYFDLKKQGKESTARKSGTLIVSLLLFLLILSAFLLMILYYPNFETTISDFFDKFFGERAGKGISKLVLVLFFGIIFYSLKYTIGSQSIYNRTIEEFSLLTDYQQKKIKRIGNIYFLISILIFITTMILLMIKTNN